VGLQTVLLRLGQKSPQRLQAQPLGMWYGFDAAPSPLGRRALSTTQAIRTKLLTAMIVPSWPMNASRTARCAKNANILVCLRISCSCNPDPVRHSGEGIFFASKVFDAFHIQSGRLHFSQGSGAVAGLFAGQAPDLAL